MDQRSAARVHRSDADRRGGIDSAARNILEQQLREGYPQTPAGHTMTAHAAARIANGGGGSPPVSLERVDDILDAWQQTNSTR